MSLYLISSYWYVNSAQAYEARRISNRIFSKYSFANEILFKADLDSINLMRRIPSQFRKLGFVRMIALTILDWVSFPFMRKTHHFPKRLLTTAPRLTISIMYCLFQTRSRKIWMGGAQCTCMLWYTFPCGSDFKIIFSLILSFTNYHFHNLCFSSFFKALSHDLSTPTDPFKSS